MVLALDATQVVIGVSGHLYVAPVGTTAPTNSTSSLNAAFLELGYTDENGVKLNANTAHFDVKAWQSLYVLRRAITEQGLAIQTVLEQWNYLTMEVFFGGGTVTGSSSAWKFTPPAAGVVDTRAMVVDVIDGTSTFRWYFPGVLAIPTGDIEFRRGKEAQLGITFEVLPQSGANPFEVYGSDTAFTVS